MTKAEQLTRLKTRFIETEKRYYKLMGYEEESESTEKMTHEEVIAEAYLYARLYFENKIEKI